LGPISLLEKVVRILRLGDKGDNGGKERNKDDQIEGFGQSETSDP